MKTIIEWLKPGARVKRYIFLQIISVALLIFCLVTLKSTFDLNKKMLIAYIALITLSAFGIIFSFILAQRNILYTSLKNISKKNRSIRVKKLLYADPRLKKEPKIVVIGGGSGLPNLLKGLKEYTANITAVVNVSEDDPTITTALSGMDYLTTGDLRKCISALSTSESDIGKLLTYREKNCDSNGCSIGNQIISSLIDISGSFAKGVEKISEIFKLQGNIYPVTTDKIMLCAGLENGEVVVGKENIIERVTEIKSQIKQIFLKEGAVKPLPEVVEAIRSANVIVLGPGALYTSVASNLLIDDISKAIIKSRAKKVYVANIMNQPGQTDGFTLARYVNEIERYIGKHVLDYAIANSGKITTEMIKDFNQESSTPVKIDMENIQNRAISVVKEDLILTAPGAIIHNSARLAEIIISIAKSKRSGNLNIVKHKKKFMNKEKRQENKIMIKSKLSKKAKEDTPQLNKNDIKKAKTKTKTKTTNKNTFKTTNASKTLNKTQDIKISAKADATIKKIKSKVLKG
ncbi:MAG: YvcK family protein [Clostridia bacterium]